MNIEMSDKEMLIELLRMFYVNDGHLYFSFRDDVHVGDQNGLLEKALLKVWIESNVQSY